MRRMAEVEEIKQMMASGIDPRKIPQLVRRINDYYNAQVVRFKDGRVDVALPNARRYNIRTFESRLDPANKFAPQRSANIFGRPTGSGYAGLAPTPQQVNFANFRVKGKSMMISGDAAFLYQHSLGGFDLDDKGIPIMSTFKDTSGKKRLAFMTLRQPTAFQESIAMTADLADPETLRTLFKDNEQFLEILSNDQKLSQLGINANTQTLQELRRIMNNKGVNGISKNINRQTFYDGVEEIAIKIQEATQGGVEIPELSETYLRTLAAIQSPSMLGLDKLTKAGTPLLKMFNEAGINPNTDAPSYSSDTIYQLLKSERNRTFNPEMLDYVSRETGVTFVGKTQEEVLKNFETLYKGSPTATGYSPGIEHKIAAAVRSFVDKRMIEGVSTDIEESIGVFINRQSSAVYNLGIARQAIDKSSPMYEEFLKVSTMFTLPASDVVDINKAVGLEYLTQNFSDAAKKLMEEQGISQDVADKVWSAYIKSLPEDSRPLDAKGEYALRLSAVGRQMSERSQAGLGFVRAQQIAEQALSGSINIDEIVGLNATLYDQKSGYSRFSSLDMEQSRKSIVSGITQYIEAADKKGRLTAAQRQALEEEVRKIQSYGNAAEAIQYLYMREGTTAYQKYATHDQMVKGLNEIFNVAEATKSKNIAQARTAAASLDAQTYSAYSDQVESVLGTVQKTINDIKDMELKKKISAGRTLGDDDLVKLRQLRMDLNRAVGQGITGIYQSEVAAGRSPDILDITETFQSLIERQSTDAEAILRSEFIEEGNDNITFTMNLFRTSRKRMLSRAMRKRVDLDAVQRVEDIFGRNQRLMSFVSARLGRTVSGVGDIGKEEADVLVEVIRGAKKAKGYAALPFIDSFGDFDVIKEYAGRVRSGNTFQDKAGEALPDTYHAYNYFVTGERMAREVADESQALAQKVASSPAASGPIANAINAVKTSLNSVATATQYKRFTDSFKNGALGEALQNKGVRRGIIAAAALATFGFVYSARKDRSMDDIAGPPLLPGGSAYETDYPQMQMNPNAYQYSNQTQRGVQYKVYLDGSTEDTENLTSMLGGVVDGPINSTMYNSLPRLGQDPYSQVASRF